MRRLLLLACLAALARADWQEIRAGQTTVLSEEGKNEARLAANHLDQFRWTVGEFLGRPEPKLHWPLTVVVAKPGKYKGPEWGLSRDGWIALWPAGGVPKRAFFRSFALQLINDNLQGRMPSGYEEALADLVSTLDVKLSRLTLGAPPPPAERTVTWAALHRLGTAEETATRLRVLLSNLANGADLDVAWRNAFPERPQPQPAEAEAYLKAGQFPTVAKLGRPVDLDRKYEPIPAMPSRIRVLPGDLLLAAGANQEALAAYRAALNERASPMGHEGYGLALLAAGATKEAQQPLEAACGQEGAGPRACIELARMKPSADEARPLLDIAGKLNPNVLDIWTIAAAKEPGPVRRAFFLKKAVEVSPRQGSLWQQLAMAQLGARQYADSEKSYRRALLEAADEAERSRFEAQREQFMQMRLDAEAADRKRLQDEERAELDRLKKEAEDRIKAAESKANAQMGGVKSGQKVEQWWDGPPTQALEGSLESVACQGKRARLSVRDAEGKPVSLLIVDANQVLLLPQGQATLTCGTQRPPRRVKIEYVPKPSAQSVGEVASVEFQ